MAFEFGSPGMAQSSMRGKSVSRGGSTRTVLKILIMWTVFGSSVTNFHISPRQGPWRREGKNTRMEAALANHWLQVRAPMQLVRTRATMSEDAAWATLGLEPGTSEEDVDKTYKQLVKKYHPDTKITGDANMLRRIVKAKGIITDIFKPGGAVEKRKSKPKSRRDPLADDDEDFQDFDDLRDYRQDEIYFAFWHPKQKSYYYVNEATRQTSWNRPDVGTGIKIECMSWMIKSEGGRKLKEALSRRFGDNFTGLGEMGFQEVANDMSKEECERFSDWLEEKAEPKYWRRVLSNRTYGLAALCRLPMEVLEDRYMRRIEIVEGLELQQRLVPGRDLRNCLRDRLGMTRGHRVIGLIAHDKNIDKAQCNEIVDLLLHHNSSECYWREQLCQYPHGFVCFCSVQRLLQEQTWTRGEIVQFMSTINDQLADQQPHELRSLMRDHAMDVKAVKKYWKNRREKLRRYKPKAYSDSFKWGRQGSIASALRSRLNMTYGVRKIDEMAYDVRLSGVTAVQLSQAESDAICEILLKCAKTNHALTRLKRELKLHPKAAVKLFMTPAERLRNICRSLAGIADFLSKNEGPPGL